MNQEERNKVYEGFMMVDAMAKNIIREAENLLNYAKKHRILPRKVFSHAIEKIVKAAKDMEHRKKTYFTWLDEMKKGEE